jgi:outer membrane immunogenic protein
MKRILLATVALTAFAATASAADLPARMVTKAPAYVTGYNWTGFYAGANLGYGWATASSTATFGGVTATESERLKGVVGGGQVGYNWQTGNVVFGLEADIQATGQKNTATVGGVTFTDKLPWFATLRGRLGLAFDRSLIYVTGGGGLANVKSEATRGAVTISESDTRGLWTIGAGFEQALWANVTAKVEYLYLDTGSERTTVGANVLDSRIKDHVVRAGLNFRF